MIIRKSLPVVIAIVALASSAYARRDWDAPPVVTTYCSGCHGVDGNTQLPYFPRLAGLNAKYAQKKLNEFKEPHTPPVDEMFVWMKKLADKKQDGSRATSVEKINMEGVAHAASTEAMNEAVLWYQKQTPAAGHGRNQELIAQGSELFLKGVPAQKVLSCITCHGQNAQGQGVAPGLAGQNAEYIESQLIKFNKGDRRHAPEMTMVTRNLNPDQAHAVALYLQSK